jgi:K+-transporting ATPase KdpF subunit
MLVRRPARIEVSNARSDNALLHSSFLLRGVPLRQSLPEAEVVMDLMTLIALVLSLLLLTYLTASLLFPEKF